MGWYRRNLKPLLAGLDKFTQLSGEPEFNKIIIAFLGGDTAAFQTFFPADSSRERSKIKARKVL